MGMASYKKLDSKCNHLVYKSSSSEDNVASAILFTHSTQATPTRLTSFPGLFPSRGGRLTREGKSPGNEAGVACGLTCGLCVNKMADAKSSSRFS